MSEREISGLSQDGETAQYVRNLRLEGRSHAQPCDQFSPHRDDGFCVLCGWAGVAHDIGSPSDHSDRDWAESSERLDAFMAEHDRIVSENERLRKALERIAKEPAPGSTISCRNIAKAALSGSTEGASDGR